MKEIINEETGMDKERRTQGRTENKKEGIRKDGGRTEGRKK